MKERRADPAQAQAMNWIAPGSALCFSLLVAFLAPIYARAFAAMPPFTRGFLAFYPLWIAVSTLALFLLAVARQIPPLAQADGARRVLEAALTVASILIIAAGLIALFMPILLRAEAV